MLRWVHRPPWRVDSPRRGWVAVFALIGFVTALQASLLVPPVVGAIVAHDTGHSGWWGCLIGVGVTVAALNVFAWRQRRGRRRR